MLTDFPEARRSLGKAIDTLLQAKIKQGSVALSLMTKTTLHEGDKFGVIRSDGKHDVSELRVVESQFTIPNKDIASTTPEEILTKVEGVAEDMANQMERNFFEVITKTVEESGNTIPGNPRLTPDALLLGMEKIQMDFEDDDRSKPTTLSVIASPEDAEALRLQEEKSTPEERAAWDKKREEILDKKYEEHMADVNSRRIID